MDKVLYIHRRETDDKIFYVGIGNPNRPYNKHGRNKHWNNVVGKHGYYVVVLQQGLTIEEAQDCERDLIELIGIENLCNVTLGGEGMHGLTHSEYTRNLIGSYHVGNSYAKGHKVSKEQRDAERIRRNKAVIDLDTGIIYESVKIAREELGLSTSIYKYLRGDYKNNRRNINLKYYKNER